MAKNINRLTKIAFACVILCVLFISNIIAQPIFETSSPSKETGNLRYDHSAKAQNAPPVGKTIIASPVSQTANQSTSDLSHNNKHLSSSQSYIPSLEMAKQFSSNDEELNYEKRLLDYEIWRMNFLEKIHERQYAESKKYGSFLFNLMIVLLILNIINFIIAKFKEFIGDKEEDWVFISFSPFSIKIKINVSLFVLTVIVIYLYYYYYTMIYPIS